jgi:hypothetical protein
MNNLEILQFETPVDGDGNVARDVSELRRQVVEIVSAVQVVDLHTHIFPPQFDELSLSGIDELLNYHYLVAELFRFSRVTPAEFWRLEKHAQADLVWRELFVENTPLSEATRGVISVLSTLGLDTRATNLTTAREFFASQDRDSYLDKVLTISRVSDVVMTNDPLDEAEIETGPDLERLGRCRPADGGAGL